MDQPLQRIDRVMWDMEMPTSSVTLLAMMMLNSPIGVNEVENIISHRLIQHPKFRQKIIKKGRKSRWHDDEDFDLKAHISVHSMDQPENPSALQDLLCEFMSQPLDPSKPLWHVHIVENHPKGGVLIWRIHHAIADGIALVKVLFSMTGDSEESSIVPSHLPDKAIVHRPTYSEKWNSYLDRYFQLRKEISREVKNLVEHPEIIRQAFNDRVESTLELRHLLTEPSRSKSKYKGKLGTRKMAAWSSPVSLPAIKAVGKVCDATVNDVVLALLTGAIRKHLLRHEEEPEPNFRVVCPMNVRRGKHIEIDNQIGMISLHLPVQLAGIRERIQHIKAKTLKLKRSLEPVVVNSILNLAGNYLPRIIELKAAEYIGERIMGVLSNVPGPRKTIYFSGNKIENIMFWIPQTKYLGVGLSIISYNDQVSIGIATDRAIINDPEFIMDSFIEEYETMCLELLESDNHQPFMISSI